MKGYKLPRRCLLGNGNYVLKQVPPVIPKLKRLAGAHEESASGTAPWLFVEALDGCMAQCRGRAVVNALYGSLPEAVHQVLLQDIQRLAKP